MASARLKAQLRVFKNMQSLCPLQPLLTAATPLRCIPTDIRTSRCDKRVSIAAISYTGGGHVACRGLPRHAGGQRGCLV
jgi:hypothetical protein